MSYRKGEKKRKIKRETGEKKEKKREEDKTIKCV